MPLRIIFILPRFFTIAIIIRPTKATSIPFISLIFIATFENREERYRGVRGASESHYNLVARNSAPLIEVELVDFGARIYTVRKLANDQSYLRVSYFILPNLSAFPGQTGGEGYSINWHVPIDDTHHWKYTFVFSAGAAAEKRA